ncbi:hypothetical protein BH23DEI1_BH23DEI1_02530 [soil metagenome]|nr:hypothetical protein [Trueperaceae bacterium]
MITPKFKVVTSTAFDRFEERLNEFIESLDRDEVVVEVSFQTCAVGESVEYSALVQYQKAEAWS